MIESVATNHKRPLSVKYVNDDLPISHYFDDDTAVVVVSHVNYKTGKILNMDGVTRKAHEHGMIVIWDLCHSAGAMPVHLDACDVDFAVGCTYKYLNGGPGAPAYIYAAKRHHPGMQQPLSGWWSHARPFDFSSSYAPAGGIKKMLSSTQPILSLRGIASGLGSFNGCTMEQVRQKSMALCELFINLVQQRCSGHGVSVVGPSDAVHRGSHVSLSFEHGYKVIQGMIARGRNRRLSRPQSLAVRLRALIYQLSTSVAGRGRAKAVFG